MKDVKWDLSNTHRAGRNVPSVSMYIAFPSPPPPNTMEVLSAHSSQHVFVSFHLCPHFKKETVPPLWSG